MEKKKPAKEKERYKEVACNLYSVYKCIYILSSLSLRLHHHSLLFIFKPFLSSKPKIPSSS